MPYVYVTRDTSSYLVYDTFTDSNDVLLSAHSPDIGGEWERVGAYEAEVHTNRAIGIGASAGHNAIYVQDAGLADCVITASLSMLAGGASALAARVLDYDNYTLAQIVDTANTFALHTVSSGAATERDSVSVTIAAETDYEVTLILQGDSAVAFVDGSNRVFYDGLPISSVTRHGFRFNDVTDGAGRGDNFKIQPLWHTVESSATIEDGTGSFDHISRPQLLDMGGGIWMLTYRYAKQHGYNSNNDSEAHIRFSDDEGRTWSAANETLDSVAVTGFPITGNEGDMSALGSICRCANGDIIVLVLEDETTPSPARKGAWLYRSTDEGETWTSQGKINSDNELMASGQTILIGEVLYTGFMIDVDPPGYPAQVHLYKSEDHGVTWTFVSEVFATGDENAMVHLGGSSILMVARANDEVATYWRRSDDLGASWGAEVDIGPQTGPIQRPQLLFVGTRLYLYGRDRYAETEQFTAVWHSDDHGETWHGPYYPNTAAQEDCAYTAMLPREDGTLVLITYEGDDNTAELNQYVLTVER